jgi:glycine/D-amino acid oxidase-like deaminating enzyme
MRTADGAGIVIIGAGLTGLGAGHRLGQLGHDDWVILEATGTVGGLAASHTDAAGFTYDIGGHVVFTRDPYVEQPFGELLADGYREIERDARVYVQGRHVRTLPGQSPPPGSGRGSRVRPGPHETAPVGGGRCTVRRLAAGHLRGGHLPPLHGALQPEGVGHPLDAMTSGWIAATCPTTPRT